MKANCWDFKGCGRECGGAKAAELGVCAAAEASRCNGVHGGESGGRACWAVAGTLCGGNVQGSFAQKISNCMSCAFYKQVREEEGSGFTPVGDIIAKLVSEHE